MMFIAIVCSLMLGFVIGFAVGATPTSEQLDPMDDSFIKYLKERNRQNACTQKKPDAVD